MAIVEQKTVLLVDDEPSIRTVLGAILQQAGYRVDVAEDGFAALRKLQERVPDLLITDLRMPNMNGFELLSVVRSRFPLLPAVVISGEFLTVDLQEGTLADAFFQKGNYSLPEFLGKISNLLGSPRVPVPRRPAKAPLWSPTGDAPVMLTCTVCLRSFPVEVCDGAKTSKQTDCLFCGTQLDIQLIAVGMAVAAD